MKKIYLLITLCLFSFYWAKGQAVESTIEYKKLPQAAAVIEIAFAQTIVEDAIKDKMKNVGYKATESKGFILFSGVKDVYSGKELNYVYKVVTKSAKEKGKSLVFLFVEGAGADMTKIGVGSDMEMIKRNLNSLTEYVVAYNLELEIKNQADKVKDTEKKLSTLRDENTKLEKKKKNIENDIIDNTKEQEKQQKELDTQKAIWNSLINRRKN